MVYIVPSHKMCVHKIMLVEFVRSSTYIHNSYTYWNQMRLTSKQQRVCVYCLRILMSLGGQLGAIPSESVHQTKRTALHIYTPRCPSDISYIGNTEHLIDFHNPKLVRPSSNYEQDGPRNHVLTYMGPYIHICYSAYSDSDRASYLRTRLLLIYSIDINALLVFSII